VVAREVRLVPAVPALAPGDDRDLVHGPWAGYLRYSKLVVKMPLKEACKRAKEALCAVLREYGASCFWWAVLAACPEYGLDDLLRYIRRRVIDEAADLSDGVTPNEAAKILATALPTGAVQVRLVDHVTGEASEGVLKAPGILYVLLNDEGRWAPHWLPYLRVKGHGPKYSTVYERHELETLQRYLRALEPENEFLRLLAAWKIHDGMWNEAFNILFNEVMPMDEDVLTSGEVYNGHVPLIRPEWNLELDWVDIERPDIEGDLYPVHPYAPASASGYFYGRADLGAIARAIGTVDTRYLPAAPVVIGPAEEEREVPPLFVAFGHESPPFSDVREPWESRGIWRFWFLGAVEHGPCVPVVQVKAPSVFDRRMYFDRDGWHAWLAEHYFSVFPKYSREGVELPFRQTGKAFVEARPAVLNQVVLGVGDWLYSRVGDHSVLDNRKYDNGALDLSTVQYLRAQGGVFMLGPVRKIRRTGMIYQVREVTGGETRPLGSILKTLFLTAGVWVGKMQVEPCFYPRDDSLSGATLPSLPSELARTKAKMCIIRGKLPEPVQGPYGDLRQDISKLTEDELKATDVVRMGAELVDLERKAQALMPKAWAV
jgi:hypothetical protein